MIAPTTIPPGFSDVDPRTARRVPLWQELRPSNSIFPGDPTLQVETIAGPGYVLEKLSLGTHTGTHVSVPAHFLEGGATLRELDESWTLMPLIVIASAVDVTELDTFEAEHGVIPAGACVLLSTGFAQRYETPAYFERAPGFTREAAEWLFTQRRIRCLGADTFGPDADSDYTASATAFAHGGITVENVGPGLAEMRPYGDWIAINGARPSFSGFQVGITGFTVW